MALSAIHDCIVYTDRPRSKEELQFADFYILLRPCFFICEARYCYLFLFISTVSLFYLRVLPKRDSNF